MVSETRDFRSSVRNINSIGEFPNVPLIILVRDYEYCVSKSINVDGSGHAIHQEKQGVVVDSIKELIYK